MPVGSDQFVVVVDLRLRRSNETVSKTRQKGWGERKRGTEAVPCRRGGWWWCQARRGSGRWAEGGNHKRHVTISWHRLNARGERYLVCGPVHPSLSTRVDVDEQQALDHVRIIQLQQQNGEMWKILQLIQEMEFFFCLSFKLKCSSEAFGTNNLSISTNLSMIRTCKCQRRGNLQQIWSEYRPLPPWLFRWSSSTCGQVSEDTVRTTGWKSGLEMGRRVSVWNSSSTYPKCFSTSGRVSESWSMDGYS